MNSNDQATEHFEEFLPQRLPRRRGFVKRIILLGVTFAIGVAILQVVFHGSHKPFAMFDQYRDLASEFGLGPGIVATQLVAWDEIEPITSEAVTAQAAKRLGFPVGERLRFSVYARGLLVGRIELSSQLVQRIPPSESHEPSAIYVMLKASVRNAGLAKIYPIQADMRALIDLERARPIQAETESYAGYSSRHQVERVIFSHVQNQILSEEWKTWQHKYESRGDTKVTLNGADYRYRQKSFDTSQFKSQMLFDQLSYGFFVRAANFVGVDSHYFQIFADGKIQDLTLRVKQDQARDSAWDAQPLIRLESRSDFEGVIGSKNWVVYLWVNPREKNRMESFYIEMGGLVGTLRGQWDPER